MMTLGSCSSRSVSMSPAFQAAKKARSTSTLLRHRLLLQAKVGEGAVAVPVHDDPGHVAVADMENFCALLVDLDRAGLAARASQWRMSLVTLRSRM